MYNLNSSTPSKFLLSFPFIPGNDKSVEISKQLVLKIYETIIPSVDLSTEKLNFHGNSVRTNSGEITFSDWEITFNVDSTFTNWKILLNWIFFINNNRNNIGKSIYDSTTSASIVILDNNDNNVLTLKMNHVWPYRLGDVKLSYRDGEQLLICNASLAYSSFNLDNDDE